MDNYRKKFPKGKDWKKPEPNPYDNGDSRISENSYHGMEIIGISIKKYDKLKEDYSKNLVERNSFLLEKESLERKVKELEDLISRFTL
tara:strand:- start:24 stop:287 length:264 start_codon:yes stop_codon:yes gene_type:complete